MVFDGDVTRSDVLRVLHNIPEKDEAQRCDRVARIKARDAALYDAATTLGSDSPGAWVVAGRVADAIDRFEVRTWPRLKAGMACDLSPSEESIYRAFLTGERVPKTARRLYDLLK